MPLPRITKSTNYAKFLLVKIANEYIESRNTCLLLYSATNIQPVISLSLAVSFSLTYSHDALMVAFTVYAIKLFYLSPELSALCEREDNH